MILIPQNDDDKVDQSAHQKVISKELRMLSCKTALVIVNSNTSPGHRGQRRHSEVKAIDISVMILMMTMILMMMTNKMMTMMIMMTLIFMMTLISIVTMMMEMMMMNILQHL